MTEPKIGFELVRGCPYVCGACNPGQKVSVMSPQILNEAITVANSISGRKFLKVHGWGEPTLVDVSQQIIEVRHSVTNTFLCLSSNAFNLEYLEKYIPHLDRLVLGLDSLDPTRHLLTRGWPNTNTLSAIDRFKGADNITLVSLLCAENIQDVLEVGKEFPNLPHTCMQFSNSPIAGSREYGHMTQIKFSSIQAEFERNNYVRMLDRDYLSRIDIFVAYNGQVSRCLNSWFEQELTTLQDPLRPKKNSICEKCTMCLEGSFHRPVAHSGG